MRSRTLLLSVVFLILSSCASFGDVLKIVINDTIQAATAERIERAIDRAAAEKDSAVLIELSTPGGVMGSMQEIIQKIIASPVPVIIYVTPSGSRAASAGFFILEAADIAAMAPGTNTGAAHPVTIGGAQPDATMKEKLENDSAAFMRSFVSKRGRNVDVAESAVRQSKSFTDQEAMDQHLIDVIAASEPDLLKQLDGRTVTRFNGAKVTLHLGKPSIVDLPMTLRQRMLSYIMDPNV